MWGAAAGVAASAALEAPDAAARRGTVHRCLASNRGAKLWTIAAHHRSPRGIAANGQKSCCRQCLFKEHCYATNTKPLRRVQLRCYTSRSENNVCLAHAALCAESPIFRAVYELADCKTLAFFTRGFVASYKTSDNRVRAFVKALESLSYVPRLPPADH